MKDPTARLLEDGFTDQTWAFCQARQGCLARARSAGHVDYSLAASLIRDDTGRASDFSPVLTLSRSRAFTQPIRYVAFRAWPQATVLDEQFEHWLPGCCRGTL